MLDPAGRRALAGRFGEPEAPVAADPQAVGRETPVFVVTHRPRDVLERQGGTSFTFVTEGLERAIELASEARGRTSPNPLVGAVVARGGAQQLERDDRDGLVGLAAEIDATPQDRGRREGERDGHCGGE